VRRPVFDAIGLFDESFRIGGFEDADFFLRARAAGFRLGTVGDAFIHHFGSITQKAVRHDRVAKSYGDQNRAYYRKKWRLGWWRRRQQRMLNKVRVAVWRWQERRRSGHTLYEKWIDNRLTFH
jgi:GT2 family glycosyltransferase